MKFLSRRIVKNDAKYSEWIESIKEEQICTIR